MLPNRVSRVVAPGELPATTSLVGFPFLNLSSGATTYSVSEPIPGVIDILEVGWALPATSSASAAHEIQFAIGNAAPSNEAAMNALPQIFPNVGRGAVGVGSSFFDPVGGVVYRLRGRFRGKLNGEALICRLQNAAGAGMAGMAWMIYESVEEAVAVEEIRGPGSQTVRGSLEIIGG